MIDETISQGQTTTKAVSGVDLAQEGSKGQSTQITVQIVPMRDADGNPEAFELELQGRVNTLGTRPPFETVGEPWTQASRNFFCIFPISLNCTYRFEHISGAPARVLLTG